MTHDHAAAQKRFAAKKSKTHKRICIYVPKQHEDQFKEVTARLLEKWEKQ